MLYRQELWDNTGLIECYEADEWADYPYNQSVVIDCSLVSPTRPSTPPPQWWIDYQLGRYFLELRQQENIVLAEALDMSLDDYVSLYPERNIWLDESQELSTEYAANNQPTDVLEFEAFIKQYPFMYY